MTKGDFSDIVKNRKPKAVPTGDTADYINSAKIDGSKPAEQAKEPTKRLNAEVPVSVYRQLRLKAMQEGTTVSELVRGWAIEYLRDKA